MNKNKQKTKQQKKTTKSCFLQIQCFRVLQLVIKKMVLKNVKKKIENKCINK